MVVSREAKKKQHTHVSSDLHDHYSELFTPRVHNKGKEREYPTLTIPCTNALHKVRTGFSCFVLTLSGQQKT